MGLSGEMHDWPVAMKLPGSLAGSPEWATTMLPEWATGPEPQEHPPPRRRRLREVPRPEGVERAPDTSQEPSTMRTTLAPVRERICPLSMHYSRHPV